MKINNRNFKVETEKDFEKSLKYFNKEETKTVVCSKDEDLICLTFLRNLVNEAQKEQVYMTGKTKTENISEHVPTKPDFEMLTQDFGKIVVYLSK